MIEHYKKKKWSILTSIATISNFYCVVGLSKKEVKSRNGGREATGKREFKDAIKQLVISSYMLTLQRR